MGTAPPAAATAAAATATPPPSFTTVALTKEAKKGASSSFFDIPLAPIDVEADDTPAAGEQVMRVDRILHFRFSVEICVR